MKAAVDKQAANQSEFFAIRHYLVLGLILCLFAALIGRAYYLQIVDQAFLADQGKQRQIRTIQTPAYRGAIFDRYGSPLAISTPVDSVWVNPGEILLNLDALKSVVKKLDLNYRSTVAMLKEKADKEFIYLKRQLEPEMARSVAEGIRGVYLQREYNR
ncbi:MAG: penicillin-binding protein 2, partial [Gammaproteobacteria bacterium]|nr:penicillin-binding protein 2 [Gammaproteobacteria bacterium]